ncbi:hypothetical protein SAMN05421504_10484 [Amycolatopsis xylanica]|uniref:Uncharacterized protein n=1 Tax=Amycolatopsis xylanica TaxID=589385 RepID=A0A1H3G326_9PSEU|nr:hypothetical protein [Amycolatopsis xylanica]SDX97098.1 hypothetical protein SAMN05421504_10484 [Amycolatopsis xylanica]
MTDEELLAELEAALRAADEVPAGFVDAGKSAFTWRGIDAELTFDSAGAELAGTRADPASVRALTYSAAEVTLEVEVGPDALHGQVVPPQAGELDVRLRDGGTTTVPVDAVGWFVVRPKPAGTFRLRLRTADGKTVLTDWTSLAGS